MSRRFKLADDSLNGHLPVEQHRTAPLKPFSISHRTPLIHFLFKFTSTKEALPCLSDVRLDV